MSSPKNKQTLPYLKKIYQNTFSRHIFKHENFSPPEYNITILPKYNQTSLISQILFPNANSQNEMEIYPQIVTTHNLYERQISNA